MNHRKSYIVCKRISKTNQHAIECSKCYSWLHKGCFGLPHTNTKNLCYIEKVPKKNGSVSSTTRNNVDWNIIWAHTVSSNSALTQGLASDSHLPWKTTNLPEFKMSSWIRDKKSNFELIKKYVTSKDVGLMSTMVRLLIEQKYDSVCWLMN